MSAPAETDSVLGTLELWGQFDAKISPPDQFKCSCYTACNASINQELREGEGCCMSYVGPRYGQGFRLAVVGMDHGEFHSATFKGRQSGIDDCYLRERCNFNPHYAGVVKTAAAILGMSGSDCRTQCVQACHAGDGSNCVINRIAQPNLVKCVPHTQGNRTSRSSRVMKVNCARHLAAELRILRPEMIVFHGVQSRWIMRPEFERAGTDLVAIEECADSYGPVLYRSAELKAHLLFLYHPSRGWLDRQWEKVEKWIAYLRAHAIIPQ